MLSFDIWGWRMVGGGGVVIFLSICGNNFEIDLIKYYFVFLNFDNFEFEYVNIL